MEFFITNIVHLILPINIYYFSSIVIFILIPGTVLILAFILETLINFLMEIIQLLSVFNMI